ncbi:MAG: hypothetical protein A2Z83_03865 [Omnitrophica bacterium GWA2_52_8]|nr:MAG: hypothetical protein A2Z83_03865 [Omnitrophica bacterium GWA2_52_8]
MKPCLKTQPAAFKILREPDRLMIRFRTPHRALSWAVAGGGFRITQTVIWYRVHNGKSCIGDLSGYLEEKMKSEKLQTAVVLLTSADLAAYCDCTSAAGKIAARCITTVGLHNALRVGDPPGKPIRGAGTINLLCRISVPLSNEALIETVSVAAEARTVAVLDSKVMSRSSGLPATGTGTDCIVVASPVPKGRKVFCYAGKHTPIGHVIGRSVYEGVRQGIRAACL